MESTPLRLIVSNGPTLPRHRAETAAPRRRQRAHATVTPAAVPETATTAELLAIWDTDVAANIRRIADTRNARGLYFVVTEINAMLQRMIERHHKEQHQS